MTDVSHTVPGAHADAPAGESASSGGAVPLVLLDVDGVLNALSYVGDPDVWPDWRTGWATAQGQRYRIQWSPTVVARIASWVERGLAEVRWLTTWRDDAPRSLAQLTRMPPLPVVGGTHTESVVLGDADSQGELAGAAAVDADSGRWWKHDLVTELVALEPGRPIVWIDDDHAFYPEAAEWLQTLTQALVVTPDELVGLTPDLLDEVESWLRSEQAPPLHETSAPALACALADASSRRCSQLKPGRAGTTTQRP